MSSTSARFHEASRDSPSCRSEEQKLQVVVSPVTGLRYCEEAPMTIPIKASYAELLNAIVRAYDLLGDGPDGSAPTQRVEQTPTETDEMTEEMRRKAVLSLLVAVSWR